MQTNSFNESLNMILNESRNYSMMIENTYHINEVSLAECIRKIDFKKIFKFIFDKFIDIIKALWDRFKAAYYAFTRKSTLIKKYRKKLENIDWDVQIDIDRSIFTNLDSSTNITMYKMSLNEEYSTLIGELDNLSNCRNLNDIQDNILRIKNNMENLDDFLNQERGIALGYRGSISKEDFAKEALLYFKPTKIIPSYSPVSPDETKMYVKDYFELKNAEKAITKDQSTLDSTAKSMSSKFNSLNIHKYLPDQEINNEISSTFVEIVREYCNRVQGTCNIYAQLFSIKLDVFKMYKEQQVQVLTKIILESIKEGKM